MKAIGAFFGLCSGWLIFGLADLGTKPILIGVVFLLINVAMILRVIWCRK